MNPSLSSRWMARNNEPAFRRKTPLLICSIRTEIPYPCIGSSASVLRTSISSVPWTRSLGLSGIKMPPSGCQEEHYASPTGCQGETRCRIGGRTVGEIGHAEAKLKKKREARWKCGLSGWGHKLFRLLVKQLASTRKMRKPVSKTRARKSNAHGHDDVTIPVGLVGERTHLAGGLFVLQLDAYRAIGGRGRKIEHV